MTKRRLFHGWILIFRQCCILPERKIIMNCRETPAAGWPSRWVFSHTHDNLRGALPIRR